MEYNYFLRGIKEEDIRDVFNLSNEDYVRKHSINTNKISWEEHVRWFKNIMSSNDNVFYVVTDSTNKFLGQLRYKIDHNSATVSISLCKEITGRGLSTKLLGQSIKLVSEKRNELENIIAYVAEKNTVSKKLFEKLNFKLSENKNGMLKYIYKVKKG